MLKLIKYSKGDKENIYIDNILLSTRQELSVLSPWGPRTTNKAYDHCSVLTKLSQLTGIRT